jgi:hypothetical protein
MVLPQVSGDLSLWISIRILKGKGKRTGLYPPDWKTRLLVFAVFGSKFSQIGGMNTLKKLMFVASNNAIFLMILIFSNCHILAMCNHHELYKKISNTQLGGCNVCGLSVMLMV